MSAEAQSEVETTGRLTVRDLARRDTGLGVPGGNKAAVITELGEEHLDMTVTEFSRDVIGTQVTESYIRKVLEEQHPAAFGITDIDEHIYV